MNSVKFQDTKLVYRNFLHFYTLRINYQKEKWRKQLHIPFIYKNKYLGKNLIKKVKDLYWKTPRHWWKKLKMKMKLLVTQSCPTLGDPMDHNPPAYSVHGILQARILEWVAIPFSRGSSHLRDETQVSCIARGFFTAWTTRTKMMTRYTLSMD